MDECIALSVPKGGSRRVVDFADDEEDREKNEGGYDSDGSVGPFFDVVADEHLVPDMALMTVDDDAHRDLELKGATAIGTEDDDDTRLDITTVQALSVVNEDKLVPPSSSIYRGGSNNNDSCSVKRCTCSERTC